MTCYFHRSCMYCRCSFGSSAIFGRRQVIQHIHHTYYCESRLVDREHNPHRSVHALDRYRELTLMASFVFTSSVVLYGDGRVVSHSFGKYSVGCTCKHMLFHPIEDSWNAMLSTMKQVRKGKYTLEKKSRNLDPSLQPSYKEVMHAPLEAITAGIALRIKTTTFVPRKETRASVIISRERYNSAIEWLFVNYRNERSACL